MFDWSLLLLLSLISLPGVIVVVPGLISKVLKDKPQKLPLSHIKIIGSVQAFILLMIFAAAGVLVAPQIGFSAPFFSALLAGNGVVESLLDQLVPALLVGGVGGLIFVGLYYFVFRKMLDEHTVKVTEDMRNNLGLAGRLLYGGIYEEVLTRWGLMSLLVWILLKISGVVSPTTIWVGIVITGVLFGLGHIPGSLSVGAKMSRALVIVAISLNLWASLLFGWLFWQYGLLAAIIGHALFHLVWYPFEIRKIKS